MIVASLKRVRIAWFFLLLGVWIAQPLELYASGLRNRCGTVEALQAARSAAAMRPVLPEERVSPSGKFKVHYTATGSDMPAAGFVDSTLSILDQMYALEVDSLGFKSPPTEDDGYYHVYLLDLDGYYGSTHPLGNSGTDVPSYIECDNDFAESYYPTRGMNGLRVTLAHEFFHVIQFGYRVNMFQVQYYEWYSTWMEDVAYPLIDDYIWYLDGYFAEPQSSLLRSGDNREYAACVFAHFVHQTLGVEAIRTTWEILEEHGDLEVYDAAINAIRTHLGYVQLWGTEFREYAAQYGAWFYATGTRAIEDFGFADAQYYPEAPVATITSNRIDWSGTLGPWGMKLFYLPNGVNNHIIMRQFGSSEDKIKGYAGGVCRYNDNWVFSFDQEYMESMVGKPGFFTLTGLCNITSPYSIEAKIANTTADGNVVFKGLYPNPSVGEMSIEFDVDPSKEVEISVFNILGQLIWRDYRTFDDIGPYYVSWDGNGSDGARLPHGTYFVRLKSGSRVVTKKFVRIQSGV